MNLTTLNAKGTIFLEYTIPKESPWKMSALNEQFRKKRGCEFSVRYIWNGAGARLRFSFFCCLIFILLSFRSNHKVIFVFLLKPFYHRKNKDITIFHCNISIYSFFIFSKQQMKYKTSHTIKKHLNQRGRSGIIRGFNS